MREGPFAALLPWRLTLALERTAPVGVAQVPPIRLVSLEDSAETTLLFGGDLALHQWTHESDIETVLGDLARVTGSADGCVVNLETQFTSRTDPAGTIGSSLRAEPEFVRVLGALGVTAVNCANNHCLDFGSAALGESVEVLKQARIGVFGVQSRRGGATGSLVLRVGGLRLGLLGYTDDWRVTPETDPDPHPAPHHPDSVRDDIRALAGQANGVIVSLHWGYEWSMYPMRSLRDLARSYVDAGACLVVCHHAHVPMGIEAWNGGVIAHGLGNLYFGPSTSRHHPFRSSSFLLRAGFSQRGVVSAEIIPVSTSTSGSVGPAHEPQRSRLLGAIQFLSGRLSQDAYLDQVERSLELHQAGLLVMDLVRRITTGDRRGVLERARYMMPSRQRILVGNLLARDGLTREMGATLERLRERPGEFAGPGLGAELKQLGSRVERLLRRTRVKGRVP